MPTITGGKVVRDDNNRITGTWTIDGIENKFTATVFPGIADFTTTKANLTYETDNDLTGTHTYKGVIGTNTFKLTLDNDVVMDGDLKEPGVVPAASVDGNGAWVKN
ncbi:hypothetical protein ABKA04_006374 [Annulohypoxylon sp. FPYF3050]